MVFVRNRFRCRHEEPTSLDTECPACSADDLLGCRIPRRVTPTNHATSDVLNVRPRATRCPKAMVDLPEKIRGSLSRQFRDRCTMCWMSILHAERISKLIMCIVENSRQVCWSLDQYYSSLRDQVVIIVTLSLSDQKDLFQNVLF